MENQLSLNFGTSEKIDEYLDALRILDWYYQHSDDGSVYRAGQRSMDKIIEMSKIVDPDRSIMSHYLKSKNIY
jgi:hypothetical protein